MPARASRRKPASRPPAGGLWDRVVSEIEGIVKTTLARLNIPTRGEIRELTRKVDELSRKIDRLSR
jgi:hypothetical protein